MNLEIHPGSYELIYDDLDTNALIFYPDHGYFTLSTGTYLEEDALLNEPFFELDDQGNAQNGGLERVVFSDTEIALVFEDSCRFLERYKIVTIFLKEKVDRTMVDFFVNHLFLGDYISYGTAFDPYHKVVPTAKREYL